MPLYNFMNKITSIDDRLVIETGQAPFLLIARIQASIAEITVLKIAECKTKYDVIRVTCVCRKSRTSVFVCDKLQMETHRMHRRTEYIK